MTYQKLLDLKFNQGVSTQDLIERFPKDAPRVREIALLDLPERILHELSMADSVRKKLLKLRKKYDGFFQGSLEN